MRVIAGEYRRRTLIAPRGLDTRPTTDRLRETLFNVLAPRVDGARFLDLYAGSGANGIEALSRGAAQVVFVENAAPALAAIRANLAALKIAGGYTVEPRAVETWLPAACSRAVFSGEVPGEDGRGSQAPRRNDSAFGRFDLVFLDPPYERAKEYAATLGLLGGAASVLLTQMALVVAEHRRVRRGGNDDVPSGQYGLLERTRVLEQGDAALSFYMVRS